MLGFIKKDLLLIKGNLKSLIFVILIYFLLMATGDFDISFIPPFLSTMIMLSTFSYDNYNNFDAYGITLPNGRRNIVLAKYLSTIILVIITTIVTYLTSILISCFCPLSASVRPRLPEQSPEPRAAHRFRNGSSTRCLRLPSRS